MLSPLSRIKARLLALLALGFLALPALALDLPAGVTQGASVEGVTEYSLQNGLRVLLAPDDSKPTTTVNMTYLVGARHENYGQTGMAHLLEHMLFRGTPTMHNALAEFSKRGLQANGSTTSDRTNYYASFAANPETLAWYLRWQADAMVNSLIAKEDLDSEMTVVRNEMERGENSPFQMLMQQMQAAAFQWHNYGHSTIGARSDVENVDIGQLQAFYRKYYQPDNAVLIVSGGFDPAATLQTIAQSFDKIARPARKLPPEYTVEPVQDGERQVILRRQGGSPLIAAMFHAPSAASPDFTALDLGVGILADTPSGRLYHALVGNNLSAEIFGFTAGMNQPGYAFFGGQLE
ncbi:MAG: M16 family metallopeptidase, partial [Pollutimonas bauzanensis]